MLRYTLWVLTVSKPNTKILYWKLYTQFLEILKIAFFNAKLMKLDKRSDMSRIP